MNTVYLKEALSLAGSRRGFCAPNPAVGAVIVRDDTILARGKHWAAGEAHAEVDALNGLSSQATDATLYVTLEPCCHTGKTPPCTEAIMRSGIQQVYYAFQDPNPKMAGQGAETLRKAGIACDQIELPEINDFYKSYDYWTTHQKPWVTAKLAMSIDAKIAGPNGKTIAITGPELQQYTHEGRKQSDAILTTINTIIHDDPQLNVRLSNETIKKPIYVLDSQLRFPLTAKVLKTAERLTVFHAEGADERPLESAGVRCIAVKNNKSGLDLAAVLSNIGCDGIHDLWVEAGGRCFQSLSEAKLIHRALIYVAPKILGPEAQVAFGEKFHLFNGVKAFQQRHYGQDILHELLW